MPSYYSAGKQSAKLLELRKKRDEGRLFFVGILATTILIGIFAAVLIIRLPWFQITSVSVSGTEVVSSEAVQKTIIRELSGNILWVIPKNSILVYPRKKILAAVASEFPRLNENNITPQGLRALSFTTRERSGVYLWCGTEFSDTADCYYIDTRGYIFAAAPSFSGTIYVKFFGGVASATENPLSQHVLSETEFAQVILMTEGLERIGLAPHAVLLLEETNEFLISSPVTSSRGRIIVRTEDAVETLLKNITAAVLVDPLKSKLANNRDGLEYIDLRFSKKVYYKFFEDKVESSE